MVTLPEPPAEAYACASGLSEIDQAEAANSQYPCRRAEGYGSRQVERARGSIVLTWLGVLVPRPCIALECPLCLTALEVP